MSHPRTKIRNKIIELLKAGVDVNQRVYDNRPDPIFETETPIIIVYFVDDNPIEINSAKDRYKRTASVNVDIVHHSREGLYDLLDKLNWECWVTLLQDETLGLDFIDFIEPSGDSIYNEEIKEQYYGICRQAFIVKYDMRVYVPNATDEFLRMHGSIDGKIENADDAIIEFETEIRS